MRCVKVTQQLSAFLDGELQPSEAERIREHLESCPTCRKERQALELTINSVKALPAMRAPGDLASRVLADIEEAEAQPAASASVIRGRFGLRLLWPAAAALLIGAGIALLSPSMRGSRFARESPQPAEREVAMFKADWDAAEELPAAEKGADDGYAYRAEDEAAQRPALAGKLEVRSRDALKIADKELEREHGLTLEGKRGVAGKDTLATGEGLDRSASTERLKEVDEDAVHMLRMEDKPVSNGAVRKRDHVAFATAPMLVEEIEIRSEDPQAAYKKVAAISAKFGGARKLPEYRPLEVQGRLPESVPRRLILNLTKGQLVQFKEKIVVAGLTPINPEKLKRELEAPLDAAAQTDGPIAVPAATRTRKSGRAGALRADEPIRAKKIVEDSPADAVSDVKSAVSQPKSSAAEAETKLKLDKAITLTDTPVRSTGGASSEPLIRVSISFVKMKKEAAAAAGIIQTEIRTRKE